MWYLTANKGGKIVGKGNLVGKTHFYVRTGNTDTPHLQYPIAYNELIS